GALEIPLLQEIRLVHALDRLRGLTDRRSERLEAHGPAAELVGDRTKEAAVAVVETRVVDLERGKGFTRDGEGHLAVVADLGVIADAFQPAIGDPRRASCPHCDLVRGRGLDLDLQDARGPADDLLERLRLEEVEVVDGAEAVPERGRQPA